MKTQNDQVAAAETAELLRLAEQCLHEPGDFVELGCYRGDTSVLLGQLLQKSAPKPAATSSTTQPAQAPTNQTAQTLPSKHLWLYDSFAGLPQKTAADASGAGANFQAGELFVSKREVIDKLHKHGLKTTSSPKTAANLKTFSPDVAAPENVESSLVIVKKAWFEDLTTADLPDEIAFAFLDGDLYQSIKISLQLVAPRLAKNGIMVVHDYNNPLLPGSARAVDEWLAQHPDFSLQVRHALAILHRSA